MPTAFITGNWIPEAGGATEGSGHTGQIIWGPTVPVANYKLFSDQTG